MERKTKEMAREPVAKGTTHRAETDPRWREAEAETEGRMAAARKER
jgi:hypothetical protein